ncbi:MULTISPECIES: iron dependent repressor, metal binding and dimerization domain protein [Dehalobacter]|jgi:Mn-dependent DtxR family transcriptional regulator|uniref:DNA-binding protein n=2 Tax=Dehalobacter restrictus TaxID=55583 RepID=A0A857DGM6_9FIRM|nr:MULTISPECIES: iron dependent repressor, metal binding and dimerization domain protein [Dehalobacter]AFV03289.1 Mn-dependent transcriptional regulator MntR [Dehalobacter sp. DCA]AFV06275.1 Mn-dependent transcriptional regulator MntR [Dehalobacter sp. CF]AHF09467.1 Iron dependent repressor [Dehalobacter restrictus DSM 9455]EQB22133.1 Mn-dependent transcriptional regulator MntR [Dehalobacter sp. UNSWDHB]MCG1026013.1 DNA-binding protein [Dehalobacter sp.]
MLSPSLEDYLEEIYRFSLSLDEVRVTDISNRLQVALPSVTKALYRLRDSDYIKYEPYGEIKLTDKGKEYGFYLVARNQLLQEFLSLICSKCNIAAEAEAMEHYLSIASIDAIKTLVEFMKSNTSWKQDFDDFVLRHTREK